MFNLLFHTSVKKDVKALDKPVQAILKNEVLPTIAENPESGENLVGDLDGLRSYHFQYGRVQYRLAYSVQNNNNVFVYAIGTRENFYDKLRRRL